MKRVFYEAVLIIAAAATIAMVVNGLRPKGIRVFDRQEAAAPAVEVNADLQRLDVAAAMQSVRENDALLIDARSPEAYEQSHIRGAVNLPVKSFDDRIFPFLEQTDLERKLITYCDGGTCTMAEELAELLYLSGFADVSVMNGGPGDADPALIVRGKETDG